MNALRILSVIGMATIGLLLLLGVVALPLGSIVTTPGQIDGSAYCSSAGTPGQCTGFTASNPPALQLNNLQTTNGPDIIVLVVTTYASNPGVPYPVVGSVAVQGATPQRRQVTSLPGSCGAYQEEWWWVSQGPTSASITVSIPGGTAGVATAAAWAIYAPAANLASPFDSGIIPGQASCAGNQASTHSTLVFSTTGSNDFVFTSDGSQGSPSFAPGTAMTALVTVGTGTSVNFIQSRVVGYPIVNGIISATQTGAVATPGTVVVDAINLGSATSSTTTTTTSSSTTTTTSTTSTSTTSTTTCTINCIGGFKLSQLLGIPFLIGAVVIAAIPHRKDD